MSKDKRLSTDRSELRRRAEKRVIPADKQGIAEMSTDDIAALLHELETHQIELEMQNEELLSTQNVLVEMRDQYTELYDYAPVGYVTVSTQGLIVQSNLTFAEMLGLPRSHLLNQRFSLFVIEEDQDNYYHYLRKLIETHQRQSCELRLRNQSDDLLWARLDSLCVESADSECLSIRCVFTDITDHKQRDVQIRTLSQAVEQSPVSVIVTDPDGVIEYVNSSFEVTTGYQLSEVKGKKSKFLESANLSKEVYLELWQAIGNGKSWQGEYQNRKKNGGIFWEHANISPVLDESGTVCHLVSINEDITLRKQQEEHILHQANFDALTGLSNRFLALDRLSQLVSEAKRNRECVAVLFLDLDDFKKINDTMGHEAGDKLLIEAATRLRSVVRASDTVGRLGGDEFIVLLSGITDGTDAIPVSENILARFRDTFSIDGRELVLTTSIGIAAYPVDGNCASELLRNADSAMYHSKEHGRNTYSFFTDAMNKEVSRRLLLEEQLHGALERDEFRICYQPVVNIESNQIVGFEALLRWSNPALGEVSPMEFIPIAEQSGHILPIGQYVLARSLNRLVNWQQQYNQPFTMAINLSPRQFRDPNLVTFIEQAMQRAGITSESLEMEITEGVLMSGHAYIDDALAALSELGVGIVMDDFGTGYSSLSYLRSYPFDTLKIDRTFVNDITVDMADRKLVTAAIAMAHSLGLTVVAEGVETEEQLAFLASQGCEFAQGYYFSKPLFSEEIAEILKSGDGGRLP
ncbi:MAG: EAL domain-containing protein [Candidatus Thiodiazotropha sp. (ex Semelilucina semeliformis)]|nr:EAL domain-containing protein [Candidatus Thiodiazotropha sp. (ex Semelilucina semeliformis)]